MVFIAATLTLSTRCDITIAVNINKISNKKTLSKFKLEQFITLTYESRFQSIFGWRSSEIQKMSIAAVIFYGAALNLWLVFFNKNSKKIYF